MKRTDMETLGKLMTVLAVPLGFLNALSGIVSVIWLLVLGDWTALLVGIALLIGSTFLIGLLMLPGTAIAVATAAVGVWTNMRGVAFIGMAFLGNLFHVAIISVWCIAIFLLFMRLGYQAHHAPLPYLLGSYALALAPWQSLAAKEAGSGAQGFTTIMIVFFAQLAFAVIMLMVVVGSPSLEDIVIVFGSIMFVVWIIQSRIALMLHRETL
jgi:hypothetical protein